MKVPILLRLGFYATILSGAILPAADKPNVVVLFADDSGYADSGFRKVSVRIWLS